MDSDPVVNEIYSIAASWCEQNSKPDMATMVPFATLMMTAVQRLVKEKGRGEYKAKVVMTVARRIVEEQTYESEADKQTVLMLVETMIPPALAAIKSASTSLAQNPPKWPCC